MLITLPQVRHGEGKGGGKGQPRTTIKWFDAIPGEPLCFVFLNTGEWPQGKGKGEGGGGAWRRDIFHNFIGGH